MIQGNNLSGVWPESFCSTSEDNRPFREFGLNCDQIRCDCCIPVLNCFND